MYLNASIGTLYKGNDVYINICILYIYIYIPAWLFRNICLLFYMLNVPRTNLKTFSSWIYWGTFFVICLTYRTRMRIKQYKFFGFVSKIVFWVNKYLTLVIKINSVLPNMASNKRDVQHIHDQSFVLDLLIFRNKNKLFESNTSKANLFWNEKMYVLVRNGIILV